MGLYGLESPYGISSWYEVNGAFDQSLGTDLMLDLSRHILESDAYVFRGIAFPKGNDIFIDWGQTFSGALHLTPFSYIVALTGFSANFNNFSLRIFDKGAQTDLYYGQFAWYPTVISNMTDQWNEGAQILQGQNDKPFGPYFFRSPLIVLPPGNLQIQVANVATQPSNPLFGPSGIMQMLFAVAEPKNTLSLQNRNIGTANDQTGVSAATSPVSAALGPIQTLAQFLSSGAGS